MSSILDPTELQKLAIMTQDGTPRQKLEAFLVSLKISGKYGVIDTLVGDLFEIGSEQSAEGLRKRMSEYLDDQLVDQNLGMTAAIILYALVRENKLVDDDIFDAVRNYKLFVKEAVVEKDAFTDHVSQRFLRQVD